MFNWFELIFMLGGGWLLMALLSEGSTGGIYGQLDLKYNGKGGFSITPNGYDFDYGKDFMIYFKGDAYPNQKSPPLKPGIMYIN